MTVASVYEAAVKAKINPAITKVTGVSPSA
jgi:hypothetical protein